MNLLVCDVDGTLVRGPSEDDRLFLEAIEQVTEFASISSNWAEYAQSTDSGVLHEIFQRQIGRGPAPTEAQRIIRHYLQALTHCLQTQPGSVSEVPGAKAMLDSLQGSQQWRAALASGAWRQSISTKLKHVGIDHGAMPGAFADDSHDRVEIIQVAIRSAAMESSVDRFERIVYLGDKPWDARAASQLGLGFVRVETDPTWSHSDGRCVMIQNYLSTELFLSALKQAVVPS